MYLQQPTLWTLTCCWPQTVFQRGISMHKACAHACTNTHTLTCIHCAHTHTWIHTDKYKHRHAPTPTQFAHLHKAESGQADHGNVVHHQYIPDLYGLAWCHDGGPHRHKDEVGQADEEAGPWGLHHGPVGNPRVCKGQVRIVKIQVQLQMSGQSEYMHSHTGQTTGTVTEVRTVKLQAQSQRSGQSK